MIHRDVLMRQIEQFAKAIATLVQQAPREQPDDVLRSIDEACQTHLDGPAADLRSLAPEDLLALCHHNDRFVPEAAQTFAQTLHRMGEAHRDQANEEAAGACFGRSLLLYRRLLSEPDAPVSWQVGTTVAALTRHVDQYPVDEDVQAALDALRNGTE